MKDGPDIARVAALIGDPARANMLAALMSGKALTASELAAEAGVQAQTASSHLAKLLEGGLITPRKSGRHKYFHLASPEVASLLEALMGFAAGQGHLRTRTGPRDTALRRARVCYNHLAGDMGVQMYRSLLAQGAIVTGTTGPDLTDAGRALLQRIGMDITALPRSRAPMCKECLDWSAREPHLAGRLGRGLLAHFMDAGWATRVDASRVIQFTAKGQAQFDARFGPAAGAAATLPSAASSA